MRIKLDECIPVAVSKLFHEYGHDVHTVYQENLSGHPDAEVWDAVLSEQRFLVTADLDFSDVRKFRPGTHHGILLLRLVREGVSSMTLVLRAILENYDMTDWHGCLVIATDHKIRVHRGNT